MDRPGRPHRQGRHREPGAGDDGAGLRSLPAHAALTNLPNDLRFLLERYPREVWDDHANLGELARFWLQRHAMFREVGAMLGDGMNSFREGRMPAAELPGWLVPRLRFFLTQLHGHHRIEDEQYFPVFRRAETRLARGFEILDGDHTAIHGSLDALASAANDFLGHLGQGNPVPPRVADRYTDVSDALLRQLLHHLDDEEDLIIPLILDRGEGPLGVGM